MSRRNVVCPSCGKKGRADVIGGPPCGPVLNIPKCGCGATMVVDKAPPKNKKPATAPDGRRRRHGD